MGQLPVGTHHEFSMRRDNVPLEYTIAGGRRKKWRP